MDIGADAGSNQDWRSAETYASMLSYGRRALAWQCLCRDRNFLNAAQSVTPASIEIWSDNPSIVVVTLSDEDFWPLGGCIFAPWQVRPMEADFVAWRADSDPAVVKVEAFSASRDESLSFELRHIAVPVLVLREPSGGEHLLIGDNACQVRLDVIAGTVLDGPVQFRYDLAGSIGLEAKLLTLQRLIALMRFGRIPRRLISHDRRARRFMMALRALDARRAGATHREIGAALYGEAAVEADWNGSSAYLRCRVQRLIHMGEALARGGYRRLLR